VDGIQFLIHNPVKNVTKTYGFFGSNDNGGIRTLQAPTGVSIHCSLYLICSLFKSLHIGHCISGIFGRSGADLDALGAYISVIKTKPPAPTPTPAPAPVAATAARAPAPAPAAPAAAAAPAPAPAPGSVTPAKNTAGTSSYEILYAEED
jgi:hypothetical protein